VEGKKDLSGFGKPKGLGKGLEGVLLAVAEQATLTCKVPAGV
jgi:hypothetical protein